VKPLRIWDCGLFHPKSEIRNPTMISLTCANCQTTLDVDDAFAGGVCRCQHCGTIQTVPRAGAAQKTLYKQKARPETIGSGTGLDDLANVVTSSGLNSGRLRRPRQDEGKKKFALLLSIAAGVIVLLLIVLAVLMMRLGQSSVPTVQQGVPTITQPTNTEPNFLNVPINESNVAYVLDRGDSSREVFDSLKNAAFASIATLGPGRRFQIIFWNNGEDFSFPLGQPIAASADNLNAARKSLEDVSAVGRTTPKSAIEKATLNNAQVVLLVTAKAWDLDETFTQEVLILRGSSKFKIHTFAIGDPGMGNALKSLAEKTGGTFQVIDKAGLKEVAGR